MILRSMELKDLKSVLEIEQQCFSHPWKLHDFQSAIARPQNFYYVALQDDTIVGYCGLWTSGNDSDLCNMAVAKKHQNHGIGKQLLQYAILQMAENGIERIVLEVRESNRSAIGLYAGLGFSQIGKRPGYYVDPKEDALLMECII